MSIKETKQMREHLGLTYDDIKALPASVVDGLVEVTKAWNKELEKHGNATHDSA